MLVWDGASIAVGGGGRPIAPGFPAPASLRWNANASEPSACANRRGLASPSASRGVMSSSESFTSAAVVVSVSRTFGVRASALGTGTRHGPGLRMPVSTDLAAAVADRRPDEVVALDRALRALPEDVERERGGGHPPLDLEVRILASVAAGREQPEAHGSQDHAAQGDAVHRNSLRQRGARAQGRVSGLTPRPRFETMRARVDHSEAPVRRMEIPSLRLHTLAASAVLGCLVLAVASAAGAQEQPVEPRRAREDSGRTARGRVSSRSRASR